MSNEITYFNSFIAQRFTGIPYSTQWMVHIDGIPDVVSTNLKEVDTQTWNIDRTGNALRRTATAASTVVNGNIFAQSVSLPKEGVSYNRVGVEGEYRGGFMQAPVITSRNDVDPLAIDFLETRDSFTDLVIRPWIIQLGFRGLIPPADPKQSIKTTLMIMQFDRGDANQPTVAPKIRKKWTFFNAVPVSINTDTVDYEKNQMTILKTEWLYTHYTLEAANDQPATPKDTRTGTQIVASVPSIPTFNASPLNTNLSFNG